MSSWVTFQPYQLTEHLDEKVLFQRVLQKQATLNKRLSAASAFSNPDHQNENQKEHQKEHLKEHQKENQNNSHGIPVLCTKSHTETAV